MPSLSNDIIPLKKCNPTRNNNRRMESYGILFKLLDLPQVPTPLYSYRILEDIYHNECLSLLFNKIKDCPNLVDAILIAKIWLLKRETNKYPDTINGFLFSMIYLHLFNIKVLNNEMECSHMFKVTLNYISIIIIFIRYT